MNLFKDLRDAGFYRDDFLIKEHLQKSRTRESSRNQVLSRGPRIWFRKMHKDFYGLRK